MKFKQFISEMNDVSGLIKTSSAEQLEQHLQKNYKTMHPHHVWAIRQAILRKRQSKVNIS